MRSLTLTAVAASAALLAGCATTASDAAEPPKQVTDPVVVTYDGGLYVMDGTTLERAADLKLSGFNRINPAGNDRHVLVSTSSGFRVLDATAARLTEAEFAAEKPGHVVRHAGKTVLFADGTGEVTVFDPERLGGDLPETKVHTSEEPHHGVAIELASGELVTTLGTEEARTGIAVLDAQGEEITRNEDCPGVHGEATAQDETVVVGCENGVLIYRDGTITKVASPTPYGRIGNQAGSDDSPIVLGDYKQDADAELERPEQVSLIDTRTGTLKLVDLGTSYPFRSLARGPGGEALVLGTDGHIHVLDPMAATVTKTIPVTGPWTEPLEWQQPRPAIFVRGGTAYVSDPGARQVHAVDLATGEKTASVTLPKAPNELSGVLAM